MRKVEIVLFVLGFLCLGMAAAEDIEDGDNLVQPIQTRTCLVEGSFSCQQYEYTYSAKGVSCTENCLALSGLNICKLTNRCVWDEGSDCFRKSVCVEMSNMDTCRRWETQAVCN